MVHVSWIENTNSKGANDIEAHMLQDNIFFTSFVWYSATINMESNITYMVQGTSKSMQIIQKVASTQSKQGINEGGVEAMLLM